MNFKKRICPFKEGHITITHESNLDSLVWIGNWKKYPTEHLLYMLGHNMGIKDAKMLQLLIGKGYEKNTLSKS